MNHILHSSRAFRPATLWGDMTILKLSLAVSKVLPQRFHRRPPKVLNLILLKLPVSRRNLPVVKGRNKRTHPLSLIISLMHTPRTSIMARLTVRDMFLSLSSSIQLCFSLDRPGRDLEEILLQNSPVMLVFSLRHLTMGVCINKQDTRIIKPINTRSTSINTLTVLGWVRA